MLKNAQTISGRPPKRAILLAAYGASNFRGKEGLRNFENLCRTRFPGWPVRWAFTSLPIIHRLANRGQKSDSVRKALLRLAYENFSEAAIQPLQTIPGGEYGEVARQAAEVERISGMKCALGRPLLSENPKETREAAKALILHFPPERKPEEDIALMGHGAKHEAVALYGQLADAMHEMDLHAHVGAMSGPLCLENILPNLRSRKVWLLPLLSLVGKHALEDMAGAGENSWKSRIESTGRQCAPVLRGMAENPAIAAIWLSRLAEAVHELTG